MREGFACSAGWRANKQDWISIRCSLSLLPSMRPNALGSMTLMECESNKRVKVSASVANLAHYWHTARAEQTESSFPFADSRLSFSFGEVNGTDSTKLGSPIYRARQPVSHRTTSDSDRAPAFVDVSTDCSLAWARKETTCDRSSLRSLPRSCEDWRRRYGCRLSRV